MGWFAGWFSCSANSRNRLRCYFGGRVEWKLASTSESLRRRRQIVGREGGGRHVTVIKNGGDCVVGSDGTSD